MSIKEITMYTVVCDRCGVSADDDGEYSCWGSKEGAREMGMESDWLEIDGKDICPDCWEWDAKEEYQIIKPLNS